MALTDTPVLLPHVLEDISDYVLTMLGAPVLRIELDQQQLNVCINQAVRRFAEWCPPEFYEYYQFKTTSGQSSYRMPDDILMVRDVAYRTMPRMNFFASDLQGSIPIEYFAPGGERQGFMAGLVDPIQPFWGRAGEWFLYKQYEEIFNRLSSANGGWEWERNGRDIILYPAPYGENDVVVQYLPRNKEWDYAHQFMQEYALCLGKIMLGRIRSKYQNIPSPGGGATLDGTTLLQEGNEEKKQLEEDLIYKWNLPDTFIHIG